MNQDNPFPKFTAYPFPNENEASHFWRRLKTGDCLWWMMYDTQIITPDQSVYNFFRVPMGQEENGKIKTRVQTNLTYPGRIQDEQLFIPHNLDISTGKRKPKIDGRWAFRSGEKLYEECPLWFTPFIFQLERFIYGQSWFTFCIQVELHKQDFKRPFPMIIALQGRLYRPIS